MKNYMKGVNGFYAWMIMICVVLQILIQIVQQDPAWVEAYYSRGFYPNFSFLSIVLFSWLPFSIGDLFYGAMVLLLCYLFVQFFKMLFTRKWRLLSIYGVQLVALLFFLHTYFYLNWGLNYFRIPLVQQIGLDVKDVTKEDYLQVLEKYITITNSLRDSIDTSRLNKTGVRKDIEEWMRQDTVFQNILCTSQIHGKQPLSSTLASYFTVSGYFNPFTLEVQVNQLIPSVSYPFVNVHELAHQMGVGFEDECNFIAFVKLRNHPDIWYRYSAYYEAVQYMLYSLYDEKEDYEKYRAMLSTKVVADLTEERAFWQEYRGWINTISSLFYNEYLKQNNQPEGMERYNMMARLVVAWDKKQ